jgi:hypothetical protein
MAKTKTPNYQRRYTFEDVWAAIMEDKELFKKQQKEAEQQRKEAAKFRAQLRKEEAQRREDEAQRREKTDREMEELKLAIKEAGLQQKESDWDWEKSNREWKEICRRLDDLGSRFGDLGNRFGELAEHLVAPSIHEKFNELGFNFEQTSQEIEIRDASNRSVTEVDIMLEDSNTVMAVEIKAKPLEKDVDSHVNRMKILRNRADLRHDHRKYMGAIAGAIMKETVRNYAHEAGFYVIEQSGDTVKISIPEGFTPKTW